jgi:hypothetical protein
MINTDESKVLNKKPEEKVEKEDFEDVDIRYNDPSFHEKIKRTEVIEEDIELVMTRGVDAVVERKIAFFDKETRRCKRIKVNISSLSRGDMIKIEQEAKRSKKEDKDTLLRVVAKGYKPKSRGQFTIKELRDMDSGFLKSLCMMRLILLVELPSMVSASLLLNKHLKMILDPRKKGFLSHIYVMIVDGRGAFCKPWEMHRLTYFQFQVYNVINEIHNEIQEEIIEKGKKS